MFGDVNSVTLIGNITNDLTVRYSANGKAVMSFGLATNRRYKMPNTDEWKDEPTFHNVVLFGNQAEFLSQRGRKGTRIYVTGRLQTRNWQDKEGKTNYKTEIVVDRILLLDRYERGPSSEIQKEDFSPVASDITSSTESSNSKPTAKTSASKNNDNIIDPDDLPF